MASLNPVETHSRPHAGIAAQVLSRVVDLPLIWCELEDLRRQYAAATPKPGGLIEHVRDALARLDPRDLVDQHPQAEGILVCTMFELARWQATWPTEPGRSVPPASFGYLLMVEGMS